MSEVSTDNNKRVLKISTGKNRKSSRVKNYSVSWTRFCNKASNTTRTEENYNQYISMDKSLADDIKDVGYFVGGHFKDEVRKKINLEGRDLITLDMDFAPKRYRKKLEEDLKGITYFIYTTHKHTPEAPRLRLIIPLSRTITIDEYEPIARKMANKIGMKYFDDTTYQASRAMYWPSTSKDGEFISDAGDGKWLDVDKVLEEYSDWKDVTGWPISSREINKPRKANKKAGDPRRKVGVIGIFCQVYSIQEAIAEFIPDIYVESDQANRYSYVYGTTVNGAVVYDDVFLYSHHDTDPAGGQSTNAFDLVRIHKFGKLDIDSDTGTTRFSKT